MNIQPILKGIVGVVLCVGLDAEVMAQSQTNMNQGEALFAAPARGFISRKPAADWEQALVTGNGAQGALVMGEPTDETLFLSHAALFLPREKSDLPFDMVSHLGKIRELCLNGQYEEASKYVELIGNERTKKYGYKPYLPDHFIGACSLRIEQPEVDVTRYQRSVDFMTGEAHVTYSTAAGTFRRSTFVSRPDDVIVVRLAGTAKQSARMQFAGLPGRKLSEMQEIVKRVERSEQTVLEKGFYLYFRNLFKPLTIPNPYNPICGYEAVGRIIAKGSNKWGRTYEGHTISDADEVLILIKIRPLLVANNETSNVPELVKALEALPADYNQLLAPHAKAHGELMGRVSFSLNAPAADRAKPTEDLHLASEAMASPQAQIERAFDAGRYNIISCTGYFPPNLSGLWSGIWFGYFGGAITLDGNLPCSIAFLSMGNTPELMAPYFRYYAGLMPGFRANMKQLYGMRGWLTPGSITTAPGFIGVSPAYPFFYWTAGAAWACQFYYDHYQCTGDRKFLEETAYPLMKETAQFYEDFLTITDKNGKVVFVPSYSPENAPGAATEGGKRFPASINATMDIGAAKQLLRHTIAAAKVLGRDEADQKKWAELIARMPPYEVGEDGSFREWLWPGLKDANNHRHASHFYPLCDEMPPEIVENPALVKAVSYSGRARLAHHEKSPVMAFGLAQVGQAAAHVADAELAEKVINRLGTYYWSNGMMSFHDKRSIFCTDISGGFPYLCASTLVYSDPGLIRFFPARPASWKDGSIKGLRLRGAITLTELTWDEKGAKAVLVSDKDQDVTILTPGGKKSPLALKAGRATEVNCQL